MKKFIVFFAVAFAVVLPTERVFAHTLKVDGNIGVTVHVEPNDEPVAGSESKIFVDVTDSSGRFNPNNPGNCECILTIRKDEEVLKTLVVVNGSTYAQLRYTFPSPGVYKMTVQGKPNGNGPLFQEFSTQFEYFIKGGAASDVGNPLLSYLPYLAAAIGVLIVLLFVV